MTERHIIVPSISAEVGYVGIDVHSNAILTEASKVKLVDVHPAKPLIVQVDGDGRVSVVDYNLKSELFSASTLDVFHGGNPAVLPAQRPQSFIQQRLSQRAYNTSVCRVDHILSNDYCRPMVSSDHSSTVSQRPKSSVFHTIKQISFCDAAALFESCHSYGKHSVHFPTSFSGTSVLAVSDTAVSVFDYASKKSLVLTEAELSKPPSSADFLYPNCCAVGCVDGAIRFWDCRTNEVIKVLTGHGKGAVVVRALPVKGDPSLPGVDGPDKVRLLSVGADGVGLVWELTVSVGPSGVVLEGDSNPTARLKDLQATTGVTRSSIHFDFESNLLSIAIGDSKIKQWDMTDMHAAARSSARSSQGSSSSGNRSKRLSLMNVVAGNRDQHDHIFGLSCQGSLKPGDRGGKKIDLTAFASLGGPYFTSDSFAIVSKTNTVSIYRSREASAGDDKSEKSSVMGAANEKSQRLQLLHEINVSSLLAHHLEVSYPDVTLPEQTRETLKSGQLRVYALSVPVSQPHILVVGTSAGVVLLTLDASWSSGSMVGVHPAWGSVKLIFGGSSIRKVSVNTGDAKHLRRLSSGRPSEESGVFREEPEVGVDFISELNVGEPAGLGLAGAVNAPKRLSFAPSTKKSAVSGGEALSSRPAFYPSPSGEYCAVVWADTLMYVVVVVDAASRGKDLVEVDRGHCLSFGWVGCEDHYLIKTPSVIATAGGKKRSSLINILAAADKEVSRLHSPQLVLMRCVGDTRASRVSFNCDALMGAGGSTAAVHLHGGPLLAVTTLADLVVVKNPATEGTATGASVIVPDVERAEREVKGAAQPARQSLVTRFYSLVTLAEAKRLEASALEAMNKPSGKSKKAKQSAEDESVASSAAEDAGVFSLFQVGPTLKCVDAVRWDASSGRCAVLFNRGDLSVFRVSLDAASSLHSLATVMLSPPVTSSVSVCDFTWHDSVLFCSAANRVSVVNCSADPSGHWHADVVHMDYSASATNGRSAAISALRTIGGAQELSSTGWSQVIDVNGGSVFVYFRDGTIKKLSLTSYPAASVCLLLAAMDGIDAERRAEAAEVVSKLVASADVADLCALNAMLARSSVKVVA